MWHFTLLPAMARWIPILLWITASLHALVHRPVTSLGSPPCYTPWITSILHTLIQRPVTCLESPPRYKPCFTALFHAFNHVSPHYKAIGSKLSHYYYYLYIDLACNCCNLTRRHIVCINRCAPNCYSNVDLRLLRVVSDLT